MDASRILSSVVCPILLLAALIFSTLTYQQRFDGLKENANLHAAAMLNLCLVDNDEDRETILVTWVYASSNNVINVETFKSVTEKGLKYPGFYKNPSAVRTFMQNTFK